MSIISESLEKTLHETFFSAKKKRLKTLSVEQLLLALLTDATAKPILLELDADIPLIQENLSNYIDIHAEHFSEGEEFDIQPSLSFQRVIQRAILHVQSKGDKSVTGKDALIAIFGEHESYACTLLHEFGITRLAVIEYVSRTPQINKKKIKIIRPKESVEKATFSSLIRSDVRVLHPKPVAASASAKLFICYSHADTDCLDRLLIHLRPLERTEKIVCWSDKKIRVGDQWRQEIKKNLDNALIAILLVSADFLASDFISDNELPPLLIAAEARGMRILPLILKPCGYSRDPVLSSFQTLNDVADPLLGLSHIEQEALYNKIADEISEELKSRQSS